MPESSTEAGRRALDAIPALAASGTVVMRRDGAGATEVCAPDEALERLAGEPHFVCHAAFTISRMALAAKASNELSRAAANAPHFDVAELFAFARPAHAALPTPRGLARALGLEETDAASDLHAIARALIDGLAGSDIAPKRETLQIARHLNAAHWPWAPYIIESLDGGAGDAGSLGATGLNVWDRIDDWEDPGPRPPAASHGVEAGEAENLLRRLLGDSAEERDAQREYAREVARVFKPMAQAGENTILLAEAGTGLGKTLGYLAPSALWAERNAGAVWISTYTKNLQRQLERETRRIYANGQGKTRKVVVRKGRENYLCLLNFQEWTARQGAGSRRAALFSALVARWARATRDGDMVGGDFPAWLLPLVAGENTQRGRTVTPLSLGLTDRRGECIYSACQHYRKCFIEKVQRDARRADLVIANHALVMTHAALGDAFEDMDLPAGTDAITRIIFDEGHHVFDAADSAFSGHLTGLEMAELRRWIRGPEARGRRGRGLADRLSGLTNDDQQAEDLMQEIIDAARELPSPGWMQRLHGGAPANAAEAFLAEVRVQVEARTQGQTGYALETDCRPLNEDVSATVSPLDRALARIAQPLRALAETLNARLDDDADELDSVERGRIEALVRGLMRRAALILPGWQDMLRTLTAEPEADFSEWFSIETAFGQEIDTGLHRHWIDPTKPFAKAVLEGADGVLITSATLKDRPKDVPDDWQNAEMRTGAAHLAVPALRQAYESPFDYGANARLIVVNDVNRDAVDQVAAAYRELMLASRGGALGLFTAIRRLRAVHERLLGPLAEAGLSLFAQHVDPIDIGTLVDLFREDRNSCLLGTDAVRDGVDVPGDSLRLIVLDRVPWPQPNVLERARRAAFGGNAYQDMIVRLRLRQAFGRLIRSARDRGVFVVLDSRLASRFSTAFPDALEIERMGLVDAIDAVRDFLDNTPC